MEALIETPRCAKNLEKIKAQLEAGKIITVQSVRASIGTQELRHYIAILKKTMEIDCTWFESTNGRRFKKYWKKK
jgi:predicted DNA-binding ArsR family transcriptional regulator